MAKDDWQIHVDGNTVTLIYTSYGVTTFTVEALKHSGTLEVSESYKGKVTDNSSIGTTAVDRHTIEICSI